MIDLIYPIFMVRSYYQFIALTSTYSKRRCCIFSIFASNEFIDKDWYSIENQSTATRIYKLFKVVFMRVAAERYLDVGVVYFFFYKRLKILRENLYIYIFSHNFVRIFLGSTASLKRTLRIIIGIYHTYMYCVFIVHGHISR